MLNINKIPKIKFKDEFIDDVTLSTSSKKTISFNLLEIIIPEIILENPTIPNATKDTIKIVVLVVLYLKLFFESKFAFNLITSPYVILPIFIHKIIFLTNYPQINTIINLWIIQLKLF